LSATLDEELAETLRLIRRYNDTPMTFADACLVRMAEKNDETLELTTDSDFRTYRKNGRQVIPLIIPNSAQSELVRLWTPEMR
jgi:hypothetical protein